MQPHLPRAPQPSFLQQEIGGVPIWVHLLAGFATCGIYLVFLPFALVHSAIERRIDRAVDRVVEPVLDRVVKVALAIVAVPARLVYRLGRLIYNRITARANRS
ncbi:hypothetical protein ACFQFC_13960 [Amorphoplanes digitatis]|uniref:Uncharacterized protein n=1 Tax=Actinoplanes digitatis TaxID=1868 RepID=A0A7W7I2M6_9ACTN|nr:hypothetical protein [Actinoplanes digitatis]MBB4765309.1 hypothetical protein [Actinoplanes digitatis]GID95044.1 hypothetical protein Adi01nite_44560 [Actinoplanes digitatis]